MASNSVSNYIEHHMQNLQFDIFSRKFVNSSSFFVINVDSLSMSILSGILIFLFLYFSIKKFKLYNISYTQNIIEIIATSIKDITKDSFESYKNNYIAPISFLIFLWIFIMNFLDLLPLDIIPCVIRYFFNFSYWRSTPTADPNITLGMSLAIFILIIFYNIKNKKFLLIKELFTYPFGIYLFPINILFKLLEEFVKPLSLSLRLFGNLFSGELVFILMNILPYYLHFIPGTIWSVMHILIITIQSFVFMMLTIIYIRMTYENH